MNTDVQALIEQFNKKYREPITTLLGSRTQRVPVIPTGVLPLDVALGAGGLPQGRVIEIYGPEGGGKSTLAMLACANAQRMGAVCAYVDVENAMDPTYAARLGVDTDALILAQPSWGEQALDLVRDMCVSGVIGLVIVDSVAALIPKEELEGSVEDKTIAVQARMMSQALRKIVGAAGKHACTVIFINQLREKTGVMYGPTETTPGGRALKFYSSVRIAVRGGTSTSQIKSGDKVIGHTITCQVTKNRVAPPFRKAQFDLLYEEGIDTIGALVNVGIETGVITSKSSWFYYGDQSFAGRAGLAKALRADENLVEQMRNAVYDHLQVGTVQLAQFGLGQSIAMTPEEQAAADNPDPDHSPQDEEVVDGREAS